MHTLILCCAGESTRFPKHRPKWTLTHPNGNIMAAESIRGLHLPDRTRILVAAQEKHIAAVGGIGRVHAEFAESGFIVEVVPLEPTPNQVVTVLKVLQVAGVRGSFTVKDCDNVFSYQVPTSNEVAVVCLADAGRVIPGNKSYVTFGASDGRIAEIAEKRVISDRFCCGAYTFTNPDAFVENATWEGETYISGVIQRMIDAGTAFHMGPAGSYTDWGTSQDWREYLRDWKTMFVDIDGVLVGSSHRSFAPSWGTTKTLEGNIAYINRLHDSGKVEVILTTARPESARPLTENQLRNVRHHRLVMGLRACARVVVNDFAAERGQHTCFAVNLDRDSDTLEQAVRAALRED